MKNCAFTQNKNYLRVFLSGVYNACCGRMSFLKRQYVEDPRLQTSGMVLLFNKGFTLIELLVVVLIIGILVYSSTFGSETQWCRAYSSFQNKVCKSLSQENKDCEPTANSYCNYRL